MAWGRAGRVQSPTGEGHRRPAPESRYDCTFDNGDEETEAEGRAE